MLDKWTGNVDGRQAVFTHTREQRKWQAHFVDQGYCFNAAEWSFPDLRLHAVYYRNWVYGNVVGWTSFEPALTLAEQMSIDECKVRLRCSKPLPVPAGVFNRL